MKKLVFITFLSCIFLFQGCATTNQFKKEERVKLVLQNGDKVKCYVTHIARGQIFFEALSSQMVYRYGDMIATGQIKTIRLSNGSELSVNEYKEYRKNVKKARLEESQLASKGVFYDAQYEKLKKKDIGKMNEKEFRYFLLMKEKENMLHLSKMEQEREARRQTEIRALEKKLTQVERKTQTSVPPQVVAGVAKAASGYTFQNVQHQPSQQPPANRLPAYNSEIARLILDANLAGELLRNSEKIQENGFLLTPDQKQFLADIEKTPQWQKRKEQLQLWNHRAENALKQAFLNNPDNLKNKLELSFDPNKPLDFSALMHQLHQRMGSAISTGDYQELIDVFGDTGAGAVKNILVYFPDWCFVADKN